ncbi:MAG TPA: hypothetical protein VLT35_06640 [Methanocella sp.]|nr:hypothetical protein [Methanocella sp.]
MRQFRLAAGIAIVLLVTAMGGCICCCGLDSLLSKLKGPVTDVHLPPALAVGGDSYSLLRSADYLNASAAKAGFKAFIPRIGNAPDQYGRSVDQMIDVGGVQQYKWFEYGDRDGTVEAGGFLAKAGSPLVADSGIQSLNAMLGLSLGIINDPDLNPGGARNLTHAGTTSIGGGGDVWHFDARYDGAERDCYFVMDKYSNVYVAVYSFESRAAAENVTQQAIGWIDNATSGK